MSDTQLWKGAIVPAVSVAALSVAGATLLVGKSGFVSASLAAFTVIIFFSVHLLVARISRDLDPMATMALAMFSYFAKVVLMGAFLLLVTKFTDRSSVDRGSFAFCAILITMAWLYGEIRSFLKLSFQMSLTKEEEDK